MHGRARVNINTAQNWFTDAVDEFGLQCSPRPRAGPCFELEVFTRAVVAITFGRGGRSDFPETFFLDHDRLVALKAEVDDLVMFEVCVEMHVMLARQLGYQGPMTMAIGQQLRTALSAIMGEAAGHGPQQWMINSEALSLEILRQASISLDKHLDVVLIAWPKQTNTSVSCSSGNQRGMLPVLKRRSCPRSSPPSIVTVPHRLSNSLTALYPYRLPCRLFQQRFHAPLPMMRLLSLTSIPRRPS